MIELSPAGVVIAMFGGLILAIVILGYPLAFSLGGIALVVGVLAWGTGSLGIFYQRLYGLLTTYELLAAPMFIFMGMMVERSGVAERLFGALYLWLGGFRGGLAIATVLIGTVLAAAVGIIAASVIMLGLVALPSMLKRGYQREIACGAVCSGGTLGILIPPSVMLIFYGPTANISVGKLFMAAFVPGLVLSGLYISYISIRCWLQPQVAPAIPVEERAMPLLEKIGLLLTSLVPPVILIAGVLGSIFLGIATPTEASAAGSVVATLLAVGYRSFSWKMLRDVLYGTVRVTGMAFFIAIGASMFTAIFIGLGGGDVVANAILSAPFGRWGAFLVIMVILFILGMFIDWLGIVLIMVPLVTPIGKALGFDALWFAMMIIVNLQMSFLTPPFAYALFYVQSVCQPEWGVEMSHIIRGVIPFVILIMVGLGLCVTFPQIILWLPSMMIK
jgi:tripartite ATP-independent transporter DctM subunit